MLALLFVALQLWNFYILLLSRPRQLALLTPFFQYFIFKWMFGFVVSRSTCNSAQILVYVNQIGGTTHAIRFSTWWDGLIVRWWLPPFSHVVAIFWPWPPRLVNCFVSIFLKHQSTETSNVMPHKSSYAKMTTEHTLKHWNLELIISNFSHQRWPLKTFPKRPQPQHQ